MGGADAADVESRPWRYDSGAVVGHNRSSITDTMPY
jgi:hypothetical protein